MPLISDGRGVIRSVRLEPTPQFFEAVARAIIHSIPKPLPSSVCYPSNPTAYVASPISTGIWGVREKARDLHLCPIWPMPRSISTR